MLGKPKGIKCNCEICNKEFIKSDKRETIHRLPNGVRPSSAVTCSKKCSRIKSYKLKK